MVIDPEDDGRPIQTRATVYRTNRTIRGIQEKNEACSLPPPRATLGIYGKRRP